MCFKSLHLNSYDVQIVLSLANKGLCKFAPEFFDPIPRVFVTFLIFQYEQMFQAHVTHFLPMTRINHFSKEFEFWLFLVYFFSLTISISVNYNITFTHLQDLLTFGTVSIINLSHFVYRLVIKIVNQKPAFAKLQLYKYHLTS